MKQGRLYIISGPSGAGKGSLISGLRKRGHAIFFSVSMTTRDRRGQEVAGVDYHYVSKEYFQDKIDSGKMLEWAEYLGDYYGTPAEPVEAHLAAGDDVFLDIETLGAKKVMELRPDAVTVFLYPVSFQVLEQRLRQRGTESEERINMRLAKGRAECEAAGMYQYMIVNDDLETAIDEAEAIMQVAPLRTVERIEYLRGDKTR